MKNYEIFVCHAKRLLMSSKTTNHCGLSNYSLQGFTGKPYISGLSYPLPPPTPQSSSVTSSHLENQGKREEIGRRIAERRSWSFPSESFLVPKWSLKCVVLR